MDSVERVKQICKIRKIPIYRLEKDLGFANGYIGQLRKGVFPADRLASIAEYLGVSTTYLLTGEKEKPATSGDGLVNGDPELTELLESVRDDPHLRMLFSLAKGATAKDVEAAIKILQVLRGDE